MMMLKKISLERFWPTAAPEVLAFTELRQDAFFSHIRSNQIMTYIEGAIAFGRQAGEGYAYEGNLAPLMANMIQSGAKVTFLDDKKQEGEKLVRAQYERKPPVIYVYRPSIEQMKRFFLRSNIRVRQEDFIALHMCHEWFHHLEETHFGRTDQHLPQLVMRKIGPVTFKQAVASTREIAAHAFTQQVMKLAWYPLLLDVLIHLSEQRLKKEQIRDRLYGLKRAFERATAEELTVGS